MWTELRPIFLGLLLFGLLNLVVTLGVTHTGLNAKFHRSMENLLPDKLDMLAETEPGILVLGTSQTNNDFDTADFDAQLPNGLASFNMGLPGTRYDVMQANLEAYRRRYGAPRLLILEVSPTIMERNTNQYYLPALQLHSLIEAQPELLPFVWGNPTLAINTRKELAFDLLSSLYEFRPIFSPLNLHNRVIAKVHEAIKPVSTESAEASCWADHSLIGPTALGQGWNPKPLNPMMCTETGITQNALDARAFYLDPMETVDFTSFRHLLAYCRRNHIPVALVIWPNHPAFVRQFAQSDFAQPYRQGLARTLTEYPIPLVDLDARKPKDLSGLFADTRHLTPKGARYFSRQLAQELLNRPETRPLLTQPEDILAQEGKAQSARPE